MMILFYPKKFLWLAVFDPGTSVLRMPTSDTAVAIDHTRLSGAVGV